MSFLALEQVEKRYPDGTHAVRGIDLSIERGEFVVLLGPSGCGKTTTLRMIAGLERHTAGSVRIDGRDVGALAPSQRDIGFVFQFYALYPHLSVLENIAFPLACAGVARAERERRAREVAARVGIEPLLARRPRELSGGDQQRVSLARAMVREPAAWLMDEPLGTLDAEQRAEMVEFLRARQREAKVTTVYVTHDQEEAMRLADRVVVMNGGLVEQCGPPARVYAEPATLFVARFVGSPGMNLVAGECAGGRFTVDGARVADGVRAADGPLVLGLRPEHVRADSSGALRGRCRLDAFHGACRYAWVETSAARIALRVPASAPALADTDVAVGFDAAHACWFDPASGRRVA
jgi:multiple sugar transport system ATP-binding protein